MRQKLGLALIGLMLCVFLASSSLAPGVLAAPSVDSIQVINTDTFSAPGTTVVKVVPLFYGGGWVVVYEIADQGNPSTLYARVVSPSGSDIATSEVNLGEVMTEAWAICSYYDISENEQYLVVGKSSIGGTVNTTVYSVENSTISLKATRYDEFDEGVEGYIRDVRMVSPTAVHRLIDQGTGFSYTLVWDVWTIGGSTTTIDTFQDATQPQYHYGKFLVYTNTISVVWGATDTSTTFGDLYLNDTLFDSADYYYWQMDRSNELRLLDHNSTGGTSVWTNIESEMANALAEHEDSTTGVIYLAETGGFYTRVDRVYARIEARLMNGSSWVNSTYEVVDTAPLNIVLQPNEGLVLNALLYNLTGTSAVLLENTTIVDISTATFFDYDVASGVPFYSDPVIAGAINGEDYTPPNLILCAVAINDTVGLYLLGVEYTGLNSTATIQLEQEEEPEPEEPPAPGPLPPFEEWWTTPITTPNPSAFTQYIQSLPTEIQQPVGFVIVGLSLFGLFLLLSALLQGVKSAKHGRRSYAVKRKRSKSHARKRSRR